MGLSLCALIINIPKNQKKGFNNNLDCKLKKINSLSPLNLSIAILKNDIAVIFWESILKSQDNLINDLNEIENDISQNYEGSEIVTIIISETANLVYFKYVSEGIIKRKKGCRNGEIMFDQGDPTTYEIKYAEISNKIGSDGEEGEDLITIITKKLPNKTYGQIIRAYLKIYSKNSSDSIYNSGTLDNIVCENFFLAATKSDYLTFLDTQPFYVYKKQRIDFKIDSLTKYISHSLYLADN